MADQQQTVREILYNLVALNEVNDMIKFEEDEQVKIAEAAINQLIEAKQADAETL